MSHRAGEAPPRAPAAWFCGEAAVSGVGSLPFRDADAAVRFVAEHAPEVPFWPQLRRMSPREAMLPQTFGPHFRHLVAVRDEHSYAIPPERLERVLAALEGSAPALAPASAAGFFAFAEAFRRGDFSRARAVKGHAMGPVTVGCCVESEGSMLFDNAEARAVLCDYLVKLARWQSEQLLRLSPSVLVVIDEAYLGAALRNDPRRRDAIVECLRSVILRVQRPGVQVGLHCCDEIPMSLLLELAPDAFSFDAHQGGDIFAADADAHRFVAGGGHVAWGWVPTLDDLSRVDPEAVAERWFRAAQRVAADSGVSVEQLRRRSLITASCGLAGSSEATCLRSFQVARAIASAFTRRCKLS